MHASIPSIPTASTTTEAVVITPFDTTPTFISPAPPVWLPDEYLDVGQMTLQEAAALARRISADVAAREDVERAIEGAHAAAFACADGAHAVCEGIDETPDWLRDERAE